MNTSGLKEHGNLVIIPFKWMLAIPQALGQIPFPCIIVRVGSLVLCKMMQILNPTDMFPDETQLKTLVPEINNRLCPTYSSFWSGVVKLMVLCPTITLVRGSMFSKLSTTYSKPQKWRASKIISSLYRLTLK